MSDQSKPVETPREWLRYAEGDLAVAEREMESETPTYHTICLLETSVPYDSELSQMVAEGAALNEYITAGRYPGDIAFEDIGKAEAAEALGAVRRIRARVIELMKSV